MPLCSSFSYMTHVNGPADAMFSNALHYAAAPLITETESVPGT